MLWICGWPGLVAALFGVSFAGLPAATRFELDGSFALPVFTRPATGMLRAAALADGGVLVEGTFAQVGGQDAQRIWRLDAQGAVVNTDFGAGRPLPIGAAAGSLSKAIQLRDGRVLVAPTAAYGSVGAPARLEVTRVALSGEVDTGYTLECVAEDGSSAYLTNFFLLPDGRVIVTGNFTSVGGHPTHDVARLTATGEVDASFTSTMQVGLLAMSASGTLVGVAYPPRVTPAPTPATPPNLVRLGANGEAAESWTLPLEALYSITLVTVDANDRVLVAINRPGSVIFDVSGAGTQQALLPPYLPGLIGDGFTIYRYQTGVADGAVFYASPDPVPDNSGVIVLQSGLIVNGMNATADGGVLLRGTMPAVYAGQPNGVLKLRADGTVDAGFTPPALLGLQVTDLQALADGWLVTGQLAGTLSVSQSVRELDPNFALAQDFSANLRQIALVEAALTLPDGSALVRGTFSGPADAVRRYVRVTADGAVDFAHVPHGTGVATLGADGKIYLGGWPRGAVFFDNTGVVEMSVAGGVGVVALPSNDNTVERYALDGTPDAGFGRRSLGAQQLTGVWVDEAGRVVLGGYDQLTVNNRQAKAARLLANGVTDQTFAPQWPALYDGMVRAVAGLPGGAGYAFLVGSQQPRLVALDHDGKLLTTGSGVAVNYVADGASGIVSTGGATFLVGNFKAVLGVASPGLVRLGANGLPDPGWHSGLSADASVGDVQVLADGRLLTNGFGLYHILNADGSLDPNEVLPPATAITQLGDGSLLVFLSNGTTQRWRQVTHPDVTVTGAAAGQVFRPGDRVTLTANGPAGASTVTWQHDGVVIDGATSAVLDISTATVADGGVYTVSWTTGGVTVEQSVRVVVRPAGARIVNVSARSQIGQGDAVQITGFVVTGTSNRPVLARSVRGALTQFGVAHPSSGRDWDVYRNGNLTYIPFAGYPMYRGAETIENTVLRAGAFGLTDLVANSQAQFTLDQGQSYAIMVAAPPAQAGVGLSELYMPLDGDTTPGGVRLKNFSCRAVSGTGDDILIVGFVVAGDAPLPVLICGRGPGLQRYGVGSTVEDPAITLYRGAEAIASNDDWETQADPAAVSAAVQRVGAGAFTAGAKDAALYVTLPPGIYTVMLDPKATPLRVGMIELFDAGE